MAKKILLTVTGTQSYGSNNDDSVELTTVGTIEETDEFHIIRYSEEQAPPEKPIKVKLSISKDEKKVEMMRSGAYSSCLIIERSKRNLCRYGTQYGDLLMGIYGRNIENQTAESGGTFNFSYDIDVNGALSSQNEVVVKYKYN